MVLLPIDLERALALEHALRASELSGICSKVVQMTSDYAKTRKQFGVPVGGFQAVQHQLSDMYLTSEALASMSRFACWALGASPAQSSFASLAAIKFGVENACKVVEKAIQLHGGIGFTWEFDLHFYLRRAQSFAALYSGNSASFEDGLLKGAKAALLG
jgi:alkylation response protein AidB-like acyl-CoA dehydrogenase